MKMHRFVEIWGSFRALPIWVQIWVAVILVPVNSAGLAFLDSFEGRVAALLGIGAMLANGVLMLWQGGFSRAMALPHILPWTGLVLWIAVVITGAEGPEGGLRAYLVVLMLTDIISLVFDYSDTIKWLRGDRAVVRAQ